MVWLGAIVGIQALALLAMAIRQSGIKGDAVDSDQKRKMAEAQLQQTSREFAEYKKRSMKHAKDLLDDVKSLEKDLQTCITPGARRNRLERLLSKASSY